MATEGKVSDVTVANGYKKELEKETSEDWNYFHKKYHPIFRKLTGEFKKVCPKDNQHVQYQEIKNDGNHVLIEKKGSTKG